MTGVRQDSYQDDDPTVLGVLYFDVLTALFQGHKEKLASVVASYGQVPLRYPEIPFTPKGFLGN